MGTARVITLRFDRTSRHPTRSIRSTRSTTQTPSTAPGGAAEPRSVWARMCFTTHAIVAGTGRHDRDVVRATSWDIGDGRTDWVEPPRLCTFGSSQMGGTERLRGTCALS